MQDAELAEALSLLDLVESTIKSRLTAVRREPETLAGRLQEWARHKYAEDLPRWQEERAHLGVIKRFHTFDKEVPRWSSLSLNHKLIVFRDVCGVPWLQANSKHYNEWQALTKGMGHIGRKKADWLSYQNGEQLPWMVRVRNGEEVPITPQSLISMALPRERPALRPVQLLSEQSPIAEVVAVATAKEFMSKMQPQDKTEKRAREVMETNTTRAAPPRPPGERLNYSVGEGAKRMQAARKECQTQEQHCERTGQGKLTFTAVSHIAAIHGVTSRSLHERYTGHIEWGAAVGPETTIPKELENELAGYIIEMADCGFGFTWSGVRALAAQLAFHLSIEGFVASPYWLTGFRKRYCQLSRRRAQYFERVRAGAMNPRIIQEYFQGVLNTAIERVRRLLGLLAFCLLPPHCAAIIVKHSLSLPIPQHCCNSPYLSAASAPSTSALLLLSLPQHCCCSP